MRIGFFIYKKECVETKEEDDDMKCAQEMKNVMQEYNIMVFGLHSEHEV